MKRDEILSEMNLFHTVGSFENKMTLIVTIETQYPTLASNDA